MARSLSTLLYFLCLTSQSALQSFAATVTLPQTGQTACWDAAGVSIPCAGTGQDGELMTGQAWPNPRFLDNGDQTETDNLTGLVWSKDANPAGGTITWRNALDYVKTLNSQNYLGYHDWRLPNVNELRSLTRMQQDNLAVWLNSQGFSRVQDDGYWTSGSDAYATGSAWYVGLDSGYVYSAAKTKSYSVWPVRSRQSALPVSSIIPKTGQTGCWNEGGTALSCTGTGQDGESQTGAAWPIPRFVNNADQTMTDNLTGLIWTIDADLIKSRDPSWDADYLPANSWESTRDGAVSWQHALDYLKKLNSEKYLGYDDWRLPNRDELASTVNWQQAYPAAWLFVLGFANVAADYYWSSSSDPLYTDAAWFVDMGSGYIDSYYKTDNHYVWPVRGKASQVIDFTPPSGATFGDSAIRLSATASSGLPVSFILVSGPATLSSNLLTISGAGIITVKASQAGNAGYAASSEVQKTITVGRAVASVTLDAATLNQSYDGTPKKVTATTAPAGLNTSITYNGSSTAPTAVGNYPVAVTLADANFTGSATGILRIAQATFTVAGATRGGGVIQCGTPVVNGATTICAVTPDAGYRIAEVSGCGVGGLIGATYTTGPVTGDCTVGADFALLMPGDCDANGAVTISEVQSAINMFLGLIGPAACVDLDRDNAVSIAEVQKAINAFLGL